MSAKWLARLTGRWCACAGLTGKCWTLGAARLPELNHRRQREWKATTRIADVKQDSENAYQTALRAGRIRLEAEARLGELLEVNIAHQGGRPAGNGSTVGTVLKDFGIEKHESHRAQKIAAYRELIPVAVERAAKKWVIRNQLGRRNLTELQFSYYLGKLYEQEKRQGERTDLTSGNCCQKLQADEKLAKEHDVSPRTVRNAAAFSQAIDTIAASVPEAKAAILSGQVEAT